MSRFIIFSFIFASIIGIIIFEKTPSNQDYISIGVVVPMEHNALTDIVNGFKKELSAFKVKDKTIKIQIKNAQGDMNLQRVIIEQFKQKNFDLFIPIGTATTQMTSQIIPDKPIVSLAAKHDGIKNNYNLTGILDEIEISKNIEYLNNVYPNLKKITLITSHSEKVFDEIKELKNIAVKKNIKIQHLLIKDLTELYTISTKIDKKSDLIFVLKDHLIVSGINTLIQTSIKNNIPLVTSDEGTVKEGANFALGVSESEIGVLGAKIVKQILEGKHPNNIPQSSIKNLHLFYNEKSCKAQNININKLLQSANNINLNVTIKRIKS